MIPFHITYMRWPYRLAMWARGHGWVKLVDLFLDLDWYFEQRGLS